MPRIQPIEKPRSLFERLAFWQTRRDYGKVIMPLKVIYARKPRLAWLALAIERTAEKGLSLDAELRLLITAHVARLNGCTFCHDLKLAQALQKKLGMERFAALETYRTSPVFSERERAALAFCEEATRERRVSDATFEQIRAHFDETEIVELTWLNAAENYNNLQTGPLEIESDDLARMQTPV